MHNIFISRSFFYRKSGSGYLTILIIVIFSFFTNLTKFWEFYFDEEKLLLVASVWRRYRVYNIFKAFFNFIFNTLVPLYFLIYMNFKIFLAVRERNKMLPRLNIKQVSIIVLSIDIKKNNKTFF